MRWQHQQRAQGNSADATAFDGKPFNGRTVAEYLGNQGAAIAALARILRETVEVVQTEAESVRK